MGDRDRLSAVIALINTPYDPIRPWPAGFASGPRQSCTRTRPSDAWTSKSVEAAFFHFSGSRSISCGAVARRSRTFASRWVFAAVPIRCEAADEFSTPNTFLEIGRGIVPDDPLVLYESGLLQEMFATQWPSAAPDIATRTAAHDRPP